MQHCKHWVARRFVILTTYLPDSVFQPFKFTPTITLNFCLHSTYNINSEALVNKLALLRDTADGRCEK